MADLYPSSSSVLSHRTMSKLIHIRCVYNTCMKPAASFLPINAHKQTMIVSDHRARSKSYRLIPCQTPSLESINRKITSKWIFLSMSLSCIWEKVEKEYWLSLKFFMWIAFPTSQETLAVFEMGCMLYAVWILWLPLQIAESRTSLAFIVAYLLIIF